MGIRTFFWLAVGLVVAVGHQSALAAPQILAVLATGNGIPFTCTGGVCQAELSAFCLQRHRPAPGYGTAYEPAARGAFTLVVRGADGGERRLPAAGHVAFLQHRGYTAVSARLAEHVLAELGGLGASIEVNANASLLPVPRISDPDPLTTDEIAHTVGPLRALGSQVVDATPDADAARTLAAMINLLPPTDRVSAERRAALWSEATGPDPLAETKDPGLSRARMEYDGCIDAIEETRTFSMRSCLESRHDHLMRDLTDDYWNANVAS